MQPRFEQFKQFIRERQYLTNVSPATLEWYKHSFKWLGSESPTEQELKDTVVRMREKGLKPQPAIPPSAQLTPTGCPLANSRTAGRWYKVYGSTVYGSRDFAKWERTVTSWAGGSQRDRSRAAATRSQLDDHTQKFPSITTRSIDRAGGATHDSRSSAANIPINFRSGERASRACGPPLVTARSRTA